MTMAAREWTSRGMRAWARRGVRRNSSAATRGGIRGCAREFAPVRCRPRAATVPDCRGTRSGRRASPLPPTCRCTAPSAGSPARVRRPASPGRSSVGAKWKMPSLPEFHCVPKRCFFPSCTSTRSSSIASACGESCPGGSRFASARTRGCSDQLCWTTSMKASAPSGPTMRRVGTPTESRIAVASRASVLSSAMSCRA